MPKLPVIKSSQLIKILNKIGFFEFHCVGSHKQFKHPDGRRTTIAVHSGKDVPTGTLRAILNEINISIEEFMRVKGKK
ncbi:MAG: type II toxin-antitoxin system HicA family toxin [Candidatus Pacebacteria bacterium]|nr:type II toxin-antitoxin system HicA family toxin [Candidatus Paceibacterota bacterium]